MSRNIDVLIIGAGPGGYVCAIRAAALGKEVVLVEKGYIGGECLNWGCIPSKALISAANYYHKLSKVSVMGITVENATIDVKKLQEWKISIQTRLINGIKQLLKGNKVETIIGTAQFISSNEIEVIKEDGEKETFNPKNIVIATGATFISLPGFTIDEKKIISAKGALELDHVPEELIVIGGGIIGLELGSVYAKLGSKLKIVELMPELLPGVDPSLTRVVKRQLKKQGVEIYTEALSSNLKTLENGKLEIDVEIKKKGKEKTLKLVGDKILLSVGKRASTKGLGLENAGIETDQRGFVKINNKQQTNIPHVFAIGDCTGMPFLAHRASKQGIVAAEVIAGHAAEADFKSMPGAIFTDPEVAFTGMTEEEAKTAGFEVITGRVPFAASGRALTYLAGDGFVKVVADANTGVILGVQIVGPSASDLISEAALAIEMGATAEDLGFTVHPHPTLPEMMMEAAELALGKAIHVMNPLKRK
ncbi:MAG: dihydrolipoyl dehydrogenase [Candidatus Hodarchaeales archaeon]|jgi:dihydrolipoamide dehydrogenase